MLEVADAPDGEVAADFQASPEGERGGDDQNDEESHVINGTCFFTSSKHMGV
jgi:hypothetical protein